MSKSLLAALLLSLSFTASSSPTLRCQITGSDDIFIYYPEQSVYLSDKFVVLQNFLGRVVTQVERETGVFSRLTLVGEPFPKQRQLIYGQCFNLEATLNTWSQLDNLPTSS